VKLKALPFVGLLQFRKFEQLAAKYKDLDGTPLEAEFATDPQVQQVPTRI
jgi:hypothetical protein